MLIENIKKYGMAVLVFFINLMLAAGGVFYFKTRDAQKNHENELEAQLAAQAEAQAANEQATEDAAIVQNGINADRQAKLESIAKNSGQVVQQQQQQVKQIIPAQTSSKTTKSS